MSKIILGIHGLGNQPPKDLLEEWWIASINEGLARIGCKGTKYNFELVYWADALHSQPLNIDETDKDNELYLSERYYPAKNKKEIIDKNFKTKTINYLKKQLDGFLFNEKLHINFPSFTDLLIRHFFKDLNIYFTQKCVEENKCDCLAKEVIREKLQEVFNKYKKDEIMLIAHSMGSIITYDVLLRNHNEYEIDTFISGGSPIAVPFIYGQIKHSITGDPYNDSKLPTPDNIKKAWYNLYDPEDKLAQYSVLQDFFEPNKYNVFPTSKIIKNDYEDNGIENPHKIYGYLRSEINAELIDEFLNRGKNKVAVWITKKFKGLFSKQ
ncbi:MAG TPA: hypothetical protein ENI57_11800 [Ignavibacteria bacterium]|nr:hypothetical protein [Ignavibacteria bacterium]